MAFSWHSLLRAIVDGKYFLKEFLAEEGEAGVYLADSPGGAEVNVRMAKPDAEITRAWPDRVSVSKSLSHPHILRELDCGETRIDGQAYSYLVSERVQERLEDVVAGRSLTAEETREVVRAVLSALKHLHQRAYQHGNVRPASIVAATDQVKLVTDAVRRMPTADVDARRSVAGDLRELAETTTELLTRKRTVAAGVTLPSPFGEFVRASLGTHECPAPTAAQLLRVLEGEPLIAPERVEPGELSGTPVTVAAPDPVPEPLGGARPRYRRDLVFLAAAVVLVLALALAAFRSDRGARKAVVVKPAVPGGERPSPVRELPRVQPQAPAAPRVAQSGSRGQWALVAAIYLDYDAAARRAARLGTQWSRVKPVVHPPKGQGKRYLVLLGSGMSQQEAERLRESAQAAGMPRDSYVTRLQF